MAYHYDPTTLIIDRVAIDADAETAARADAARFGTPYQVEFARARARYTENAEGAIRDLLWIRERDAALAKMSERERRICQLREIAHLAPMIDDTAQARAEAEAAEREFAVLLAELV